MRRTPARPDAPARPILKWAGGKRQLLPQLRRFYPGSFARYVEPFVGSGAVFLDLYTRGRLDGCPVLLADINPDVVGCYHAVRDAVEEVIAELATLADAHRRRGSALFYEVRDERFNPARRAAFVAEGGHGPRYSPELAAMLIYLNRTGYNGLYRLNARGDFNVPAGRYAAPRILDAGNLRRVSRALAREGVSIANATFETILRSATAGDFLYIDPPYAPVSPTARFTAYTAGGFGLEDQAWLRDEVVALACSGCHVLVSNSTAPAIRRLYVDHLPARQAGLRAHRVPARRAINSRGHRRGPVLEYLITNVPASGPAPGRETV